jgi:acyl carrier protein
MTRAEDAVREDLVRVLGEIKRCDPGPALAESGDFMVALGFDSLDVVQLATHLDQVYGIKFGARRGDTEALASVDKLAEFVVERRAR